MNIKTISIDSLEYDPFNVREHDERNVDAIKASLARFGQQKPIVVKKDGTVIAGNGTLGAMRMLGYKEVVVAETELEGEEAVAFAIADNRTAELADWDNQALAQALDQLGDELLPASGFDENELSLLMKELGADWEGAEVGDEAVGLDNVKTTISIECKESERNSLMALLEKTLSAYDVEIS